MLVKMLSDANVATALDEMRVSKKGDIFKINPLYGESLLSTGKAEQVHEVYNYYE